MNFNFYRGRYGWDNLSKIIFLASLPLMLSSRTIFTGLILMGYSVWRTLSKNFAARGNEAIRFENWVRAVMGRFSQKGPGINKKNKTIKQVFSEKLNYKIVSCTKCGQKLRLPRKKGRIVATCKRCGYEFKLKT